MRTMRWVTVAAVVAAFGLALPTTATAAAGAAGPGVPIAKGVACLPGTWTQNLVNSPAGMSGATTTSEGAVTLQFGPARQFAQTYAVTVTAGQPGPNGVYLQLRQETTGTVTGTWTATVRKLKLAHVRNDTATVSSVQIDDRTSDPATQKPAPETFPAKRQSVPYRCSGDTLRLQTLAGISQGYTRTG